LVDWSQLDSRTLSRPDALTIALERLMFDGELSPGERLPGERELAQMLAVSRASVRDALRDLEQRGLVDRRPGRGTVVTDPSATPSGDALAMALDSRRLNLAQVMEVRACIEPQIALRTAQRATARDVAALTKIHDSMASERSSAKFAALDRTFHHAIAIYSHNPLLVRLLEAVNDLIAPSRSSSLQSAARRRSSIDEHIRILQAIAAHDPVEAQLAAQSHVESVQRRILGAGPTDTRAKRKPAIARTAKANRAGAKTTSNKEPE
jgi:GntR family transcriptional regulator, transcriptional repressor for pyruvate dehydrogenase complex